MLAAMPGSASRSSPKRRGPSSRASTTSSDQRSPTGSRAAWSPDGGPYDVANSLMSRSYPTGLHPPSRRLYVATCNSLLATPQQQHRRCTLSTAEGDDAMSALEDLAAALRGVHDRAASGVVGIGRGVR